MPHDVIMPALGMAQQTGQIVAWHKQPGDAVSKGDILFEVETDKATMEVEAQADGFLTDVSADEGTDVPVGNVIAIISPKAPTAPVVRKAAPAAAEAKPATVAMTEPEPAQTQIQTPTKPYDRVLASPKARRLARQQGFDLTRLAEAGHPQPFHVKDLEALKSMHTASASMPHTACRLTAGVQTEGFTEFAAWAKDHANLFEASAILAGFCSASLGQPTTVAVETLGATETYAATDQLSAIKATENAPQVRLRDLRSTAITTIQVGADNVPTLTLMRHGNGLTITLEYDNGQLEPSAAIALLSNFAGRMEQPLRHLL